MISNLKKKKKTTAITNIEDMGHDEYAKIFRRRTKSVDDDHGGSAEQELAERCTQILQLLLITPKKKANYFTLNLY